MFIELLVVGTCVQAKGGCAESMTAYSVHNEDVQLISKRIENYGRQIVENNEWIVYAATPVYAIASGNTAELHVEKRTTLLLNVRDRTVFLKWNY